MPKIYSASAGTSDDGLIYKLGQSSWANARDATSGTVSLNNATYSNAIAAQYFAGRGGGNDFRVFRSFFVFDTSGITGTVASAKIGLKGYVSTSGSAIAVKSTAFGGDGGTALASGDINAISGWSAGSSLAGSATVYGSQITSWNGSAYNEFTGSSDLLADIKNNNVVIVCVMNYTQDYLNSAPTSSNSVGTHFAEYGMSGVTSDPYIDYTLATGYGNAVNGIAAANISKVNGIATASISKVNGV